MLCVVFRFCTLKKTSPLCENSPSNGRTWPSAGSAPLVLLMRCCRTPALVRIGVCSDKSGYWILESVLEVGHSMATRTSEALGCSMTTSMLRSPHEQWPWGPSWVQSASTIGLRLITAGPALRLT
jgi:hypothetical protein